MKHRSPALHHQPQVAQPDRRFYERSVRRSKKAVRTEGPTPDQRAASIRKTTGLAEFHPVAASPKRERGHNEAEYAIIPVPTALHIAKRSAAGDLGQWCAGRAGFPRRRGRARWIRWNGMPIHPNATGWTT